MTEKKILRMSSKVDSQGIRIDSHKLIFHPERVSEWLKGKDVFPIFCEVSPTSACNQRCVFCGLDYAHDDHRFIDADRLKPFLKKAAGRRLRSVLYSGEGEPLLHKGLSGLIEFTKKSGIDAALATNAVFMDAGFLERCMRYITWIRISMDAATPGTYARIHGTGEKDFGRAVANVEAAVRIKKKQRCETTIGLQFLLLRENRHEAERLTAMAARMGVNYVTIKPYSKHPLSANDIGAGIDYTRWFYLESRLKKYEGRGLKVIFRKDAMSKRFQERPYRHCLGLPFWCYISAAGDVYPCSVFVNVKKYSFGNIHKDCFETIWDGPRRKRVLKYLCGDMDARKCRELCRLDEINKYLWELAHPHPHVNFI